MTFMNQYIDHEMSEEARKWLEEEIAEQEERYAKIAKEMDDLAPTREQWYQEFFDRISTIGFNMDADDKMVIPKDQLPVKPEGLKDKVVWKYGVDGE